MAFQKGYVQVTVEVLPAPGAFLAANPASVRIPKGDLAQFVLNATPLEGFAGLIYLRVANLAGVHAFSVNPIPAGGGQSTLSIDTSMFQVGTQPFDIEAVDVLPPGEDPVGPTGLDEE